MVDAYKVSKDLSIVKLDEFFCEMELHELANTVQKEKGIALVAGEKSKDGRRKKEKKEKEIPTSSSSSESDDEGGSSSSEMANFMRRIMRRSRRYKGKGKSIDQNVDKTNFTCYECSKKGHYRSECPKLKKKEERAKKKKALKATWDESSSSSSEEEKKEKSTRQLAFMAREESDSGSDGDMSDTSAAGSSSSDDEEETSPHLEKCYKTIAHLSTLLRNQKLKSNH